MTKQICTCCGQTIKAAKVARQPEPVTDTYALSEADARAYFKATAPIEDAKFFLARNSLLTPAMRLELQTLIAAPPARKEFYSRLVRIQNAWRELALAHDRAERLTENLEVAS